MSHLTQEEDSYQKELRRHLFNLLLTHGAQVLILLRSREGPDPMEPGKQLVIEATNRILKEQAWFKRLWMRYQGSNIRSD